MVILQHNLAFGRALRELRKQRRYSQEVLAFESGLDRTYISSLELGQRSPTLNTMVSLSKALEVTLAHLITLTQARLDEMNDNDRTDPSAREASSTRRP